MTTNYFPLLLQSAWKASIIPLGDDTVFFAMKAFGNYDMIVPFVLAVLGATVGQMFNFGVGKLLARLKNHEKFAVSDDAYNHVAALFNRYGIFLLLFSWVPLCNLLVVLAGLLGAKPKIALPLIIAGQAFNYGRTLF